MIHLHRLLKRQSVLVFLVTIIVSFYWFLAQVLDVYRFPALGAMYEMSSVGMLIILFGLPVFSFIHWAKDKFHPRSLYFYSLLILGITIVVLITQFS